MAIRQSQKRINYGTSQNETNTPQSESLQHASLGVVTTWNDFLVETSVSERNLSKDSCEPKRLSQGSRVGTFGFIP
ncbi:hypothetical protein RSAG8_13080, partial [Rhizoctonia solani AG-8 WAC10335]